MTYAGSGVAKDGSWTMRNLYVFCSDHDSARCSYRIATMAFRKTLSYERYLEILERVVFEGHYLLSADPERQRTTIQIFGGRVDERGLYLRDANGTPIQSEAEPWEAEQFRRLAGDLQHELGPPGLTDHLTTLDLNSTDFDLKRFFARTKHRIYPKYPAKYQIAVRTLNGYVSGSLTNAPTVFEHCADYCMALL